MLSVVLTPARASRFTQRAPSEVRYPESKRTMSISAESAPRGEPANPGTSPVAQLGRYTILFRFASGGMAEVFVARMRGAGGFEKPVAIKRMLPSLAEEPRFVDMFLDEARIAAMVTSPNVVPTFDVDTDEDGAPYIVMELVIGASLSQLQRGMTRKQIEIPIPVAVEVIAQAAQGLHDAHEATRPSGERLELVHRDVSPQNILVGVDGRARIMDFGIARALERVTQTSTGEVKGKLAYFSPEQASASALDGRSDVFALGIVAWELLVGKRLFQRDSPSQTLFAVLESEMPAPHTVRAEIPESVSKVVMHALERSVEKRCPSAAAFAQSLRACGLQLATPTEVGAWVGDAGGETLTQFRTRVASSFSGEPTKVVDAKPRARAQEEIEVKLEATQATSATVNLTPQPVVTAVAEPPKRSNALALVVGAGLLLTGVVAFAYLRQPAPVSVVPDASATPIQPTPPAEPATVVAPPEAPGIALVPAELPNPAQVIEPVAQPTEVPTDPGRPRRVPRPTASPTEATAPAEPVVAREVPTPPVEPTAAPPPVETTPSTTPRGRLMGLDRFRPTPATTP
jgi:serine/threonine-protein kinase